MEHHLPSESNGHPLKVVPLNLNGKTHRWPCTFPPTVKHSENKIWWLYINKINTFIWLNRQQNLLNVTRKSFAIHCLDKGNSSYAILSGTLT